MNDKIIIDDKFKKVMQFVKNKKALSKSNGISNLYIIQKIDENNNIVDEYYGENLMTDYGMTQYFISNVTFPTTIYIGNGTGSFNSSTSALLSPITTVGSTLSNSTKSFSYPMYFDNVSGLITCITKYMGCYFDYTISGVSSDISITEYGIGSAYNSLWTHSWVYDVTGAKTNITKKTSERLSITVYMCMSYYDALIDDNYDNGIYTMITSMESFFNSKLYETSCGTFKCNNKSNRTKTNVSSTMINNSISRYTTLSDFQIYNDGTSAGGYIDGFFQMAPGFEIIERQTLTEPENVSTIVNASTTPTDNLFLSTPFGVESYASFTQLNTTSVSLFNYQTGDWDNAETFESDSNVWYNEYSMTSYMSLPILHTNNDTIVTMYLHCNMNTIDPIIALDNEPLETIYVTDKYWDMSTWVLLTDYKNIPTELQTKRYWITNINISKLIPRRLLNKIKVIPQNEDIVQYQTDLHKKASHSYGCSEYGWYCNNTTIYIPSNNTNFDICEYTAAARVKSYGKWLLAFLSSGSSSFNIYDMSDLSTIPTKQTISCPFTSTNVNTFSECYRSLSSTGILCLSAYSRNELVVIDMRTDEFVTYKYGSSIGCCIVGTNKIAYIPSDDTSIIRIFDVDTQSIDIDITIESNMASSISTIFGYNNKIWVTSISLTKTRCYDITNGTSDLCNGYVQTSIAGDIDFAISNEVIIIYNDNTSMRESFIELNNPTNIRTLSDLYFTRENASTCQLSLSHIRDNTLALIYSSTWRDYPYTRICNKVVDFGLYLKTGEIKSVAELRDVHTLVLYGDYIIDKYDKKVPLEYWLPHKIVGTTNTITATNSIKNISNKQWAHAITNVPVFNGVPPGTIM